jgi:hypothetical protein
MILLRHSFLSSRTNRGRVGGLVPREPTMSATSLRWRPLGQQRLPIACLLASMTLGGLPACAGGPQGSADIVAALPAALVADAAGSADAAADASPTAQWADATEETQLPPAADGSADISNDQEDMELDKDGAALDAGDGAAKNDVAPDPDDSAATDGGTAPSDATTSLPACPKVAAPVTKGWVTSFQIKEGSGLAASQVNPDTLWTHNDSGAAALVYAIGSNGSQLAVFKLNGAKAVDWEDIAVGPGPKPGASYLYVGDIGDNGTSRSSITVYRVEEPKLSVTTAGALDGVEAIPLKYPDKPHNAETLLVDPLTGDLYIVVKDGGGTSPVFRAAAPLTPGATMTLSQVALLQFGKAPLEGDKTTTGGDISPDGQRIAIRTYKTAYLWRRPPGMAVAEALAGPPCPAVVAKEGQGEALGFAADGKGYYTFSEGSWVPLSFYALP